MKLLVLVACVGLVGLMEVGASPPPTKGPYGTLVHLSGERRVTRGAPSNDQAASVVRAESEIKPEGFRFTYETDNGISEHRDGVLRKVADAEAVVVQGSYQYTAQDGTPIQVNYEADENGFRPSGAHIPTPPPVPEAIARSIAYIAAHPPPADKKF